jgi:hypothetical protein
VPTDNPKFASDVIHPRTMEFLMTGRPPGFRIEGSLMRFSVDKHETQLIGFCAELRPRVRQPGAVVRLEGSADHSARVPPDA